MISQKIVGYGSIVFVVFFNLVLCGSPPTSAIPTPLPTTLITTPTPTPPIPPSTIAGINSFYIVTGCFSMVLIAFLFAGMVLFRRVLKFAVTTHILYCMMGSWFVASLAVSFGSSNPAHSITCRAQGFLWVYSFQAASFWLLMFSYQFCSEAFDHKASLNLTAMHVICWGIPFIMTLMPLGHLNYGKQKPGQPGICTFEGSGHELYYWYVYPFFTLELCVVILATYYSVLFYVYFHSISSTMKMFIIFPCVILAMWLPYIITLYDQQFNSEIEAIMFGVGMFCGFPVILTYLILHAQLRSLWWKLLWKGEIEDGLSMDPLPGESSFESEWRGTEVPGPKPSMDEGARRSSGVDGMRRRTSMLDSSRQSSFFGGLRSILASTSIFTTRSTNSNVKSPSSGQHR